MIYAAMFAFNLGGSLAVAGSYGGMGVATVIAAGAAIESALLFAVAKRRLGLRMFVWRGKAS
jgi:hypothetical protein